MSDKKKTKLLILEEWELEEQESWFNDMAKEGWFLENLTFGFAVFRKGEPRDVRYRLEIATRDKQLDEELVELYEDAGWAYITSRRFIHVFAEKEQGEPAEIHTDPRVHAEAVKRLKQSIFNRGMTVILLTLIFVPLQLSFLFKPSSFDFLTNSRIFNFYIILLYFFIAFHMTAGMLHISRLITKLKNNTPFDHNKPYKKKWKKRKASYYIFALLSIVFFIVMWNDGRQFALEHEYEDIPSSALPVITLPEVEEVSLREVSYGTDGLERQRENHVAEQSSVFVPNQYKLEQKFIVSREPWYEPALSSYRFEARYEWIAERLVAALRWERVMDYSEEIELAGFDEAWLLERHEFVSLIARTDEVVYDIRYRGKESSDRLIQLLKELIIR